jgi:hypothetical protein
MLAVQIQAELLEEHDTSVDEKAAALKIRIRRKPRETESTEAVAVPEAPSYPQVAPAPVAPARLDALRVKEQISRRGARALGGEDRKSDRSVARIQIDFVRSQDKSQQIAIEADGFVLRGVASGASSSQPAARLPGMPAISTPPSVNREARPITVSVAVDGFVYAVRVAPGDTARDTALALIERLSSRYSAELIEAGDERARVRMS